MPKFGAGHEVTKEHRDMFRVLFSSEYCHDLTEWEESFLESLKKQSFLSEKQLEILHKVFDEVTTGIRHQYDDVALDDYGDL